MGSSRRRKKTQQPKRHRTLDVEDGALFLWLFAFAPFLAPAFSGASRAFDVIGWAPVDLPPLSRLVCALVALPLIVVYCSRAVEETTELRGGVGRLGVGPTLYFLLIGALNFQPDSFGAFLVAFGTLVLVGISGVLANENIAPVMRPQVRRLLVFPAILAGSTYVSSVRGFFEHELLSGTNNTTGILIFGAIVGAVIAVASYFFGVIAPRTLAGDVAPPLAWLFRFVVYAAGMAGGEWWSAHRHAH